MTDQSKRTNPLMIRPTLAHSRPAFVNVNGQQIPTDLDEYCAHLNAREHRRGLWVVVKDNETGERKLDWREEIATDGWLRENGLMPKIGRRA